MQCARYEGEKSLTKVLLVPKGSDLSNVPKEVLDLLGPLKRIGDINYGALQVSRATKGMLDAIERDGYYIQDINAEIQERTGPGE